MPEAAEKKIGVRVRTITAKLASDPSSTATVLGGDFGMTRRPPRNVQQPGAKKPGETAQASIDGTPSVDGTPKDNATVIASKARSVDDELRRRLVADGHAIEPPVDMGRLAEMPQESGILQQCIDAYEVNVDAFGHDFEYIGPPADEPGPQAGEAEAETPGDPALDEDGVRLDEEMPPNGAGGASGDQDTGGHPPAEDGPPPLDETLEEQSPFGENPEKDEEDETNAGGKRRSTRKDDPVPAFLQGKKDPRAGEKPPPQGKPGERGFAMLDEDLEDELAGVKPRWLGRDSKEAQDELKRVKTFFATCHPELSFVALRRRLRRDITGTGNGYLEVLRASTGEIAMLEHAPCSTMLICPRDTKPVEVTLEMLGPDGSLVKRTVQRRFRRFVQIIEGQRTYFKEFGDPRRISARDGSVEQTDAQGKVLQRIPDDELANEMIHFVRYDPTSPYGLPCFIGTLPSIRGERLASVCNLRYFQRSAIPALALLVGGGQVTDESVDALTRVLEEELGGVENAHRIAIIEAMPEAGSVEEKGTVTMRFERLRDVQLSDGQFLNYKRDAIREVRSSFRLPPIYVGLTDEQNYATAQAARITAEEQVFAPEREQFDDVINRRLLRAMGIKFWRFYSLGPEIADVATYTAAVTAFTQVGAMTVNEAISLANELLGTNLATIEEAWGNYPFPMVMQLLQSNRLIGLEDIAEEPPNPLDALMGGGGFPGFDENGDPLGKAPLGKLYGTNQPSRLPNASDGVPPTEGASATPADQAAAVAKWEQELGAATPENVFRTYLAWRGLGDFFRSAGITRSSVARADMTTGALQQDGGVKLPEVFGPGLLRKMRGRGKFGRKRVA